MFTSLSPGVSPWIWTFRGLRGSITSVCEPKIIVFTEKNMFGKQRLQVFFFFGCFWDFCDHQCVTLVVFARHSRRGWWHLTPRCKPYELRWLCQWLAVLHHHVARTLACTVSWSWPTNGLETKATSILKVSMVRVYGTLNFSKSVMIRFSLVGKKRIVLVWCGGHSTFMSHHVGSLGSFFRYLPSLEQLAINSMLLNRSSRDFLNRTVNSSVN